MGFLDLVVLAAYFMLIVFIGSWFGRKEAGTEDFFLGGRKMPWLAVMLSIMATEASALTFIGVPAEGFRSDYAYLQFGIGSIIGRFLIAYLFLPAFFGGKVTTVYELLKQRFGAATQRTATLFFFATRLLASGVRLLGAAIALSVVTDLSLVASIVLAASIAVVYTAVGGIKAVIWTDVVQICVFFGGAVVALVILLGSIDGGWSSVVAAASVEGKMQVFHLDFDLSNPSFLIVGIISGCFLTFAALGTDQDLTQRMLTCKNLRESRRALIWTGFLDVPVVILFLVMGTALYTFYLQQPDAMLPTDADHIFPHFIVSQLPPGFRGLLIAGVFAAAMSSLDSALGALTSSAVVDLYRPLVRPAAPDAHYLRVSRMLVPMFGLALVAVALVCSQFGQVLWLGFKIGSFTYGSMLGIFLVGVLSRRGSDAGNVAAMLSSVVVVILLGVFDSFFGIAWPWFVVVGTLWTVAVAALTPGRPSSTPATGAPARR